MYTEKALSGIGTIHNNEETCWNNHLIEEETEIKKTCEWQSQILILGILKLNFLIKRDLLI